MDFKFDLKEWAGFSSLKPTVLTVCMDTRREPDMKFLVRRGREIRDLFGDDREVRENFLKALKQVREFLEDDDNLKAPGVAIIADPSNNIFSTM